MPIWILCHFTTLGFLNAHAAYDKRDLGLEPIIPDELRKLATFPLLLSLNPD